jgi:hypothetical protein
LSAASWNQPGFDCIVVDFDTAYHGTLGRLVLTKFIVVLHYTYLIMKMPTPNRVNTVRGVSLTAHSCEKENNL